MSFKITFALIFAAALISGLGDGLIPIAFALQAHRVDPSGRGLTMVLIALWAGRFLTSLLVRKLPPPNRPVSWMLASDFVRMLAQWGLVAWLVARGDSITAFAFSSFVYGCASSFFNPARFGLLAQIFSNTQRTRVNGTLSMLGDVLFIAGPLIGTAAMLTWGFRTVLIFDGATFLVAMLCVLPFFSVRTGQAPESQDSPALESETAEAADSETTPATASEVATAQADVLESPVPEATASTTKHMERSGTNGSANSDTQDSGSAASRPRTLPGWVQVGLGTWLVAAVVNGFLGSAGPTWIMNSFDEKTWGFMATALAVGSLAGSAATVLKALDRVRFSTLQTLMLVFLAGQVMALAFSPVFALIAVVGAVASLLMTASGIAWDSLGQSLGDDDLVHQFATKDQLVFTAGTPLGMILFALLSNYPGASAALLSAALVVAAVLSSLQIARSPRAADMAGA